ncbi:MAG TPA: MBL fold metallo-hydrolase [Gemmatimonadaceae bacterium]|nr:MBL fold metallo-hydrolase [Gemmatimonadaceae bacterium]
MRKTTLAVAWILMASAQPVCAQDSSYTDVLPQDVRARARAVPGELPIAVRYLNFMDDSSPASDAVDGAPHARINEVTPVFQVRYRQGWIMVDAGMTHAMAGKAPGFSEERYQQVLAALRGARLIVVTHEHPDHVGTLVRSPIAADVASRTLLTRQQVETMVTKPTVSFVSLDSTAARRYLVVDYDRLLPIAPGVVLIRSPGHTPGSQIVYVRLASGRELMLTGDIAWRKAGIDEQRQKPDSVSRQLSEDRIAIAQEMAWLKHTVEPAGIAVVVSHDGEEIAELGRRGMLSDGLDVTKP